MLFSFVAYADLRAVGLGWYCCCHAAPFYRTVGPVGKGPCVGGDTVAVAVDKLKVGGNGYAATIKGYAKRYATLYGRSFAYAVQGHFFWLYGLAGVAEICDARGLR